MISKKLILLPAMVLLSVLLATIHSLDTQASSSACSNIEYIFARGSGLPLGESAEWIRFRDQLKLRLQKSSIKHSSYELGTASQNGHKYPAADVRNVFNGNATGAWISAGTSFDYGKSVNEGIQELTAYFVNKAYDCPDTKFVLAGYSQGAQVVGSFASYLEVTPQLQEKVVFVALFGDPKLHLPEGEGWDPPACRNEQLSPWRRIIEDCRTDNGSLGARKPYVSDSMKNKVGTWCINNDFICGSSKFFFVNDGHGKYTQTNGSIDKAVLEIATKLTKELTPPSIPPSPDNPNPNPPSPPSIDLRIDMENFIGSDVMILYDNRRFLSYNSFLASSFSPRLFFMKFADVVTASGGRIGMLSYCGCDLNMTLTYYSPLSNKPDSVIHNISGLEYDGPYTGKDVSEDLRRVLTQVQQNEDWRPEARHIILVYSFGTLYQQQATTLRLRGLASAISMPNWHIYPLTPPEIATSYKDLSAPNSKVHLNDDSSSIDFTANAILDKMDAQLTAELTNTSYESKPGEALTFDASPSIAYKDTITSYHWDYTSDGIIDETTEAPTVQHTYAQNFNGNATVHIVTDGGLSSSKTALVNISSEEPGAEAAAPHNLYVRATSATTAELSWQPSDNKATSWVIYVNDVAIARIPAERHSINISDIEFNKAVMFSVRPLDKDLRVGKMAFITLEPGQHEAQSPLSSSPASKVPRREYRDSNEVSVLENKDGINNDRSSSTRETKNESQEDTPKESSQTKLLQNLRWIDYAIWGTVITAGVFLISLASWYIRKRMKWLSN